MTKNDLIERAKRRLGAVAASEIDLAACVNDALHELSGAVMMDNMRRAWMQQDYEIALDSNGESTDLLTALGSVTGEAGEIMIEGIHYGLVKDADGNVLKPLFHYNDFISPQDWPGGFYFLKNSVIATRAAGLSVNGPADIVGVTGPLTITASFTPVNVTDIRPELEDNAVSHLVEVVMRKLPANANARFT